MDAPNPRPRGASMGDCQRCSQPPSPSAPWDALPLTRDEFTALVWERGAELYRELPWRGVDDPYAVLVSEVMLQQTQVKRVLRFWPQWLELFPTVDALAAADTAAVLEAWQGLGYNRRALALKRACERCAAERGGELPRTPDELEELPGIGPATAAGVVAFAYQKPAVYLETNVRSVFLHELFPEREAVPDRELLPLVADTCPDDDPRGWYYALLDYGAHLKSQVANPSRRSAHHARQSAFEGSHRQKRSFLLKQVLAAPEGISRGDLHFALNDAERAAGRDAVSGEAFEVLLDELVAEGFFHSDDDLLVP